MSREELVAIVKELTTCGITSPDQVVIVPPNSDESKSDAYQLHVKAPQIDSQTQKCIQNLVEPKGFLLTIDPEKQLIIVYSPKK